MHVLQICAVILSFISLLFLLISLGSNNWVELIALELQDITNLGLWYSCTALLCIRTLSTSSFEATKAFMFLGLISGAVSSAGLCFTFRKSHIGSISMAMVSAIASLVAGICIMIAMSVFTAGTTVVGPLSWYGWSFGLGWTSFLFYLLTGGVAFAFAFTFSVTTE